MPADVCPEQLRRWCAHAALTPVALLSGGATSQVITAVDGDGQSVVVKHDPRGAVRSEAAWLRRHVHGPDVLAVDADASVIVLEHVDAAAVAEGVGIVDAERERAWISYARDASGPLAGDEADVADLFEMAWQRIRRVGTDLGAAGPLAAAWIDWLAGQDRSRWRSVAFDVIPKNTLAAGDRWWVIDPMCVLGPDGMVGGSWTLNRTQFAHAASYAALDPGTFAEHVAASLAAQDRFVAGADDPDEATTWAAGFSLWRLGGTQPGTARNLAYALTAQHWLSRWARR